MSVNWTGSTSANVIALTDDVGRPLNASGPPTEIYTYDGTTIPGKTGLTSMATAVRKRASSWGGAGLSITGDGATVATGAFDGTMGAGGGNISIGHDNSGNLSWNGTIRNVRIWTTQLSDGQLQAMTA